MPLRFISHTLLVLILTAAFASAQQYPPNNGGYPQPSGQNVQQDQPVQPQTPTIERRNAQPGQPQPSQQPPALPPGFPLTKEQEAQVDQVLNLWEKRNLDVKTFDSRFKRWVYDTVFGRPDQPRFVELGVVKYASPDRGMFKVDTAEKNGQEVAIEDARAEHWVSDGKAIIEFSHVKKQKIVHKLPPEMQGKAIADGPLPFLFNSDAKKLKQRYFLCIVTPRDVQGQIWLRAYPRFQQDAANFRYAEFIISAQKMEPYALNLIQPNGKDRVVYQFFEIVINDPLRMFRGDPFRPSTPIGWQSIVEEPQGAQAQRAPNDGRR